MICISIAEKNIEGVKKAISQYPRDADVIEIRFDNLNKLPVTAEISELAKNKPRPLIATCRANNWADDERLKVIQSAIDAGFDYVDIEYTLAGKIRHNARTKIILSYHNFDEMPNNLHGIYDEIAKLKPDIVKIATHAKTAEDNFKIFKLLDSARVPSTCFCMGELGRASRVLGRKFGSVMTYAAPAKGKETAAGQFTADELANVFNYKKINRDTKIYGLIGGDRILHSLSPVIHNAAFNAAGINAAYVPFRIDGDPSEFIRLSRGVVDGFSVTIPHKEAVIPALDGIDDSARAIGATNTILSRGGKYFGSNTDCGGAISAIELALPGRKLRGLHAAVLGTGGAARAIAYGLIQKGADVAVYGRSHEKTQKFARELSCDGKHFDDIISSAAGVDILANATSIGMYPEPDVSPIPAEILRENMLVFDAVYTPEKTRLLRDAYARGCRVASGMDMFIEQAAVQFKMRTGLDAPRDAMTCAVRKGE